MHVVNALFCREKAIKSSSSFVPSPDDRYALLPSLRIDDYGLAYVDYASLPFSVNGATCLRAYVTSASISLSPKL